MGGTTTRRSNTDSPKVYNLDAVEAEAQKDPFRFALKGKRFELPNMGAMDRKEALAVSGGSDVAAGMEILKKALGEQWEAFDALPLSIKGLNTLLEKWTEHSGMELGEAPASTGS